MKTIILFVAAIAMCGCAWGQSIAVPGPYVTMPYISTFTVQYELDVDPVVECFGIKGHWGDSDYTVGNCMLGKGKTLDDLMTEIVRDMAVDQKANAAQIAKLRSMVAMLCALMQPVKPRPTRKKRTPANYSTGAGSLDFYYLQDDGTWGTDKHMHPSSSRAIAKKASVAK